MAPYSLSRTVGAFSRFPAERVDRVTAAGFRRAFATDGGVVLLEASQAETPQLSAPVSIEVVSADDFVDVDHAISQLQRQLAIDEPIADVHATLDSSPDLRPLTGALAGLRRTIDPTPFEGLVSSILAQLISIAGAAVVRSRFVEAFGQLVSHDGDEYWTYPSPESLDGVSRDRLASLGMTGNKAKAILAVAEACKRGELTLEQLDRESDEAIVTQLVAMPGVGPWTAEWFLVNVMGRMSVVPAGDLGIRRSTGNWMLGGRMPTQAEVRELYEPFGERRAYIAYFILSAERFQLQP